MNLSVILDIALALVFCAAAITLILSWRNTSRSIRRMKLLYAEEAPPVPDVEVRLKTGETVSVSPVEPHRAYIWLVPIPCAPHEVDEVVIPELPPWTQLVPVPAHHET